MKENRIISFIIILISYTLAFFIGLIFFKLSLSNNFYINLLIGDVAATIVIYVIGLIFKNASVYDPYWSVAPIVIIPLVISYFDKLNFGVFLVLFAILYWGIILTINWVYTFKDLNHQDWRYTLIKEKTNNLYQLANFFGIHLMPTLIVFSAMLPAIYFVENLSFTFFSIIGFVMCMVAVTIQLISDIQVHKFRKSYHRSKTLNTGLWKNSRHPNYFGEVLMWWGVYFMCLLTDLNCWYLFIGAFLNTLLFIFISIPLQENRLITYKEGYKEYIRSTSALIPWFKKQK